MSQSAWQGQGHSTWCQVKNMLAAFAGCTVYMRQGEKQDTCGQGAHQWICGEPVPFCDTYMSKQLNKKIKIT